MKPPAFRYAAPVTVPEALSALAEAGSGAKVLAGGQSLLPILNMRLAAPSALVDINRVDELAYVRAEAGGVRIGALARHADVQRDRAAARVLPLLGQALDLVAHPTIRNRGTTVGSLVHADPSGEMTAVLALVGGSVELARADRADRARREVSAPDFFVAPLESAVEPGELAVSAWFPALPPSTGTAFVEVARRHGDYAVCGLAAAVTVDESGAVARARAAYISVAGTPLLLDLTDAVSGARYDAADWAGAGRLARDRVEPESDIHASAGYRRHLVEVLTARALREAAGRARVPSAGGPPPLGDQELSVSLPGASRRKAHDRDNGDRDNGDRGNGDRGNGDRGNGARGNGARGNGDPGRKLPGLGADQPGEVQLVLNGAARRAAVPPRRLLSDFLRHDLGQTGTHVGCEHGVCGACTVLLDGRPVRSCLVLAASVDGCDVTTVEGLAAPDGTPHPVQQAFRECHGLQCGYCTPGFLTTIAAYLQDQPDPSEQEAREAIAGNLCRCTGYQNIVRSVLRAAEIQRERSA